jgi:hypothetical protein
MEATAKVIPWNAKAQLAKEALSSTAGGPDATASMTLEGRFGALEGYIVMIPDDQLDALGSIFAASPLRGAMTFEGYLIAKGFGHPTR